VESELALSESHVTELRQQLLHSKEDGGNQGRQHQQEIKRSKEVSSVQSTASIPGLFLEI